MPGVPAGMTEVLQMQGLSWGDPGLGQQAAVYFQNGQFVTPTLADAGGQVYNVKAYGAKGDSTTDDSAAIQRAVNAAALTVVGSTTYATIYFPQGTYKLASTITIPAQAGIKFQGAGKFATALAPTNSAFTASSGNAYDVCIMDMQIYGGNNQISTPSGASINRLTVERVAFQAASSVSVNVASGMICASFKDCLWNNNGGDNLTFADGVTVNNLLFEQCEWTGTSHRSYVNFNDTHGNVTLVKFDRCLFEGPSNSNTVAWLLLGGITNLLFDHCHWADANAAQGQPLIQTYGVSNGAPVNLTMFNCNMASSDGALFNVQSTGAFNGKEWVIIGCYMSCTKVGSTPFSGTGKPGEMTIMSTNFNGNAQGWTTYSSGGNGTAVTLSQVEDGGTWISFGVYGQTTTTGNTHTVAAGSTTSVFTNTTFDGSTGSTAYTVGDIVKALKQYGLLNS